MAEYCKDCAEKYGMKNDNPELCEGCGNTFKIKGIINIFKELLTK